MKKSILVCLFLFTIACIKSNAQQAEATVLKLHESYGKAVEQKDSVFLKELFHDNMIVTGGNGTRRTKAGEIRDALDPAYKVNFFRSRNVDVRIFGETAIVTGELYWEMVNNDKTSSMERSFTFAYSKFGNTWKIVAQHIGRTPSR